MDATPCLINTLILFGICERFLYAFKQTITFQTEGAQLSLDVFD
jgi:hypothetical protein